ncbi:MAG: DUF4405 domain-containing protein [Planctomycetes bacterium]|nr:DUF4405 domain-containing protein [Planctomycetota bacterium]
MHRTMINFWLDVTLLFLFLAGLWTSFVLRFVFPPGTLATDWRLWGWTYDHWADCQFVLISIFALAVLIHVMLHWTWVCGVMTRQLLRKKDGKRRIWGDGIRTLYGVGLLVVLFNILGVAFAAAMLMVKGPS